jgi:HAD superfamily hydrolase (TIGR01549 family)
MNSNSVRDLGFEKVLAAYPKNEVDKLLNFHRENGGLSRYVKFRYFFEEIRKENISDNEVNGFAEKFSVIMKKLLIDPSLLISETLEFVKRNYLNYEMHIVSGSDQNELRFLCKELNISQYFKSVNGSPSPKNQLLEELIIENKYSKDDCIMIGDSINDYEAAISNSIHFLAYGNLELMSKNFLFNTLSDLEITL